MQAVVNVLGIFLAVVCVVSALGDFARVPSIVETMTRLGVPPRALVALGAIKVVLAVLVVVGLFAGTFAVVAGVLLSVYFIGAVSVHARVKDVFRDSAAAWVLLTVSFAYLLTALAV